MKKTGRISTKRLLLSAIGMMMISAGVIAGFALQHLHFSYETSRTLALIQGNHHPVGNFHATRPTIVGQLAGNLSSHAFEPPIAKLSQGGRETFDTSVEWLEVDVAISAERQLITFYDDRVDPTTNSEESISDLEYEGSRGPRQRVNSQQAVQSLTNVFNNIQARHQNWIFNIKESGIKTELLSWLEERIAEHDLEHERVKLFGTEEVIKEYQQSGYPLGYVVNHNESLHWLKAIFRPTLFLSRCIELNCEFLVIPSVFAAPTLLQNAEAQNIQIWITGLKSASEYVYFAKRRVPGFVTSEPQIARQAFEHAIPAGEQSESTVTQSEGAGTQSEGAAERS